MKRIPRVTVLMPVYNAEKYLRKAINSILSQTFKDFEFIIINDRSTDTSEAIITSYTDPRIRYFSNSRRLGATKSLNRGIRYARGIYIARMDADDISLPDRLLKQVAYLEANPLCTVLATRVNLIDSNGNFCGKWADDLKYVTYDQIRKRLPASNCIAHASVMIRAFIIKKYRYNGKLRYCQDHELWLRLCADNHRVEKINEPLHCYRIKISTFTTDFHETMEYKLLKLRVIFLSRRLKQFKFSRYELITTMYLYKYLVLLLVIVMEHLCKIRTKT